jgi:HAMP domain-containing protein
MNWGDGPVSGGEGIAGLLLISVALIVVIHVVREFFAARAQTRRNRETRRLQHAERSGRAKAQAEELTKLELPFALLTTQNPDWSTASSDRRRLMVNFVLERLRTEIDDLKSNIYWDRRQANEAEEALAIRRSEELGLPSPPSREHQKQMEHEIEQWRFNAKFAEEQVRHHAALLAQYESLSRSLNGSD